MSEIERELCTGCEYRNTPPRDVAGTIGARTIRLSSEHDFQDSSHENAYTIIGVWVGEKENNQ